MQGPGAVNNIIANTVAVTGPDGGMLVYSTAQPELGSLLETVGVAAAGEDAAGNFYLQGGTTYLGGTPGVSHATLAQQDFGGETTWSTWNGTSWTPIASAGANRANGFQQMVFRAQQFQFGPLSGNAGLCLIAPSGDTTGVTDLANITNALTANNNTPVWMLAGVYYINNTIAVPQSASLSGIPCSFDTAPGGNDAPLATCIKLVAGSNKHMVSFHGDNAYLGNIELDGQRSLQTSGFGNGILINGYKYITIEGVSCHDNFYRGMLLTGTGTMGIKILRCVAGSNNDTGIYLDSTVTDCVVLSSLCGQNGVHGIYDAGDVNHILANDIYTNAKMGIYIANGAGHLIANNGIDRNQQHGLYIRAPLATVTGNTFHTNSQAGNGLYDSIYVDNSGTPGVEGVSIEGNNFWQDPGFPNLPAYHVFHNGPVVAKVHGSGFQPGSYVTNTINVPSAPKDPNETG